MVSSIVAALLGGAPLCAAPSLVSVPLTFEPGLRKSEFIARSGGLGAHLSPTAAVIGPGRMRLIGANRTASAQAEELLPGYSNYLVGKDSRSWRTHVPNYRRIRYHNVYPGIDVVYYGNPRELEFDFVVAPGRPTHGGSSLRSTTRICRSGCPAFIKAIATCAGAPFAAATASVLKWPPMIVPAPW